MDNEAIISTIAVNAAVTDFYFETRTSIWVTFKLEESIVTFMNFTVTEFPLSKQVVLSSYLRFLYLFFVHILTGQMFMFMYLTKTEWLVREMQQDHTSIG